MVDDPFLFGQVAAANALSDVYAMGGEPKLALNLLCFPNCLGIEVAGQILAGGADRCQLADCVVAGGHSINDHEPKYGLSVTGFVQLDGLLANAGAKVGDALVLTKALGTGVITTAYKGGLLDEAGVRVATDSMIRLNDTVGRVGGDIVRHACTDVTGFSLMGHSCEMAEASGVTLQIDADAVPMLDGAREMARMGMLPAGAYRNRDFFGPRVQMGPDLRRPAGERRRLAGRRARLSPARRGPACGRHRPGGRARSEERRGQVAHLAWHGTRVRSAFAQKSPSCEHFGKLCAEAPFV